jgi:type 1 glutamine amidotransferase
LRESVGFPVRWRRALRMPDLDTTPPLCLVLYYHHRGFSAHVDEVRRYVEAGGGLLAVHGVSASHRNQPMFADLLGGTFTDHGRPQNLKLEPCHGRSNLPGAVIREEPYVHTLSSDTETWYEWLTQSTGEPTRGAAAWTRRHGQGKVAYLICGHTRTVWRNQSIRSILAHLIAWSVQSDTGTA